MKDAMVSETYRKKLISIEQGLEKIKSNMEIVVSNIPEPQGLLEKFHTIADRVENVKVFSVLLAIPYEFITDPSMKGHFELVSWFHGTGARGGLAAKSGIVTFAPNMLHNIALDQIRTRKPNIFMGSCTPPDKHGFVSLSLGVSYEKNMIENADIVIMEVSEHLPRTFGDTPVHMDDIDFFIETHRQAPTLTMKEPSELDLQIGAHIADLVEDGSTIQLGIGGIPNAVGKCLNKKKDLGVHTEMLVDAMMELYQMGVITNKKKTLYKDKFVCTFISGTKDLYDWADNNVAITVRRGYWVNDPAVVRQNSKMVSINTCMMVDLTGQVFSESIGTNQFSGTGGQFDTAMGAREAYDGLGKSIIACASTAKAGKISTIVSMAPQGTPVTLHRGQTDWVSTEYGAVNLRAKTVRERVAALISIAHPNFRDQLWEEAGKLGYL
jgi:acyl-CoA hydrolase